MVIILCIYVTVVFRTFLYVLCSQAFYFSDGAWRKRTTNEDEKHAMRQVDGWVNADFRVSGLCV